MLPGLPKYTSSAPKAPSAEPETINHFEFEKFMKRPLKKVKSTRFLKLYFIYLTNKGLIKIGEIFKIIDHKMHAYRFKFDKN